jgi:hypothetical protein
VVRGWIPVTFSLLGGVAFVMAASYFQLRGVVFRRYRGSMAYHTIHREIIHCCPGGSPHGRHSTTPRSLPRSTVWTIFCLLDIGIERYHFHVTSPMF